MEIIDPLTFDVIQFYDISFETPTLIAGGTQESLEADICSVIHFSTFAEPPLFDKKIAKIP